MGESGMIKGCGRNILRQISVKFDRLDHPHKELSSTASPLARSLAGRHACTVCVRGCPMPTPHIIPAPLVRRLPRSHGHNAAVDSEAGCVARSIMMQRICGCSVSLLGSERCGWGARGA